VQSNKNFLLFYNFALIQRCLFKTISFFKFNLTFMSVNALKKLVSANSAHEN
jgi:hypothetical protein